MSTKNENVIFLYIKFIKTRVLKVSTGVGLQK